MPVLVVEFHQNNGGEIHYIKKEKFEIKRYHKKINLGLK